MRAQKGETIGTLDLDDTSRVTSVFVLSPARLCQVSKKKYQELLCKFASNPFGFVNSSLRHIASFGTGVQSQKEKHSRNNSFPFLRLDSGSQEPLETPNDARNSLSLRQFGFLESKGTRQSYFWTKNQRILDENFQRNQKNVFTRSNAAFYQESLKEIEERVSRRKSLNQKKQRTLSLIQSFSSSQNSFGFLCEKQKGRETCYSSFLEVATSKGKNKEDPLEKIKKEESRDISVFKVAKLLGNLQDKAKLKAKKPNEEVSSFGLFNESRASFKAIRPFFVTGMKAVQQFPPNESGKDKKKKSKSFLLLKLKRETKSKAENPQARATSPPCF